MNESENYGENNRAMVTKSQMTYAVDSPKANSGESSNGNNSSKYIQKVESQYH
jgi:hypothetical protein